MSENGGPLFSISKNVWPMSSVSGNVWPLWNCLTSIHRVLLNVLILTEVNEGLHICQTLKTNAMSCVIWLQYGIAEPPNNKVLHENVAKNKAILTATLHILLTSYLENPMLSAKHSGYLQNHLFSIKCRSYLENCAVNKSLIYPWESWAVNGSKMSRLPWESCASTRHRD